MPGTAPPIFRPDRRPSGTPRWLGGLAPQLTLAFNSTLSRVEITAVNLGGASCVVVDRSLDGVRWTTVRGAAELALTDQAIGPHYDYEFGLGTVTYRVRAYDALGAAAITLTGTIATSLDAVWLKSCIRPFLNMQITLGGPGFDQERPARGSGYEVANRALPVAVTELAGSKRYDLRIRTTTDDEDRQLDFLLASGDVLFLHAPAGKVVPAGGVWVKAETDRARLLNVGGTMRHRLVPVMEVAAPGPDVGYALLTWQTILNNYGTLSALLNANSTLGDLLSLLAEPSEVIVQ